MSREFRIVTVMALGFGLVGIDRFLIATLYPVIARDLHLSYGDIGVITGALALAWGVSALFTGNASDRLGRRLVLVGSLIVFSALIGASGLATGLAGLVAVRVVMGFADGAYTPTSIAATLEASAIHRRGLNIGIQQMMLPLCGLGIAPLLVSWLLKVINWRWVFLLFVLPGLALAYVVSRLFRAGTSNTSQRAHVQLRWRDWLDVLKYRNVVLGGVLMLCWLTCLITTSAFLPNYFVDHLNLPFGQMSTVMSAIGLGSTVGTIALPWLSDATGRKPIMVGSTIGALASLLMLAKTGVQPNTLFAWLFMVHFFNNALITLTVGPLCSETVPPALMATASGVVIAIGELVGGGLTPIVVGQIAQRIGIEHLLRVPCVAMVLGLLVSLLTRETRPTARRASLLSAST
ncbi:MAG TPA: MFS transporter [Steroidobacteraceae bacterium]|nr:MFS transporter [Steroidobacteraceae bacterium]